MTIKKLSLLLSLFTLLLSNYSWALDGVGELSFQKSDYVYTLRAKNIEQLIDQNTTEVTTQNYYVKTLTLQINESDKTLMTLAKIYTDMGTQEKVVRFTDSETQMIIELMKSEKTKSLSTKDAVISCYTLQARSSDYKERLCNITLY